MRFKHSLRFKHACEGQFIIVGLLQVILAANDLPSINDVTYPELIEIIAKVTARFLIDFSVSIFASISDSEVSGA